MPATPDDQSDHQSGDHPRANGSDTRRDQARASQRDEDQTNLDRDEEEEGQAEEMSGWCGEISDYVAANPLKAVAISFMTGWVASRVLW